MSTSRLSPKHFGTVLALLEPWDGHTEVNRLIHNVLTDWQILESRLGRAAFAWADACKRWSDANRAAFAKKYGVRHRPHASQQLRAAADRIREGWNYSQEQRAVRLHKALSCIEYNTNGVQVTTHDNLFRERVMTSVAEWLVTQHPAYADYPWFI